MSYRCGKQKLGSLSRELHIEVALIDKNLLVANSANVVAASERLIAVCKELQATIAMLCPQVAS